MAEVRLYDSTICRLCAEDNGNGELLYMADGDDPDLSSMVNRYLPLKVRNFETLDSNLTSCFIHKYYQNQMFDISS